MSDFFNNLYANSFLSNLMEDPLGFFLPPLIFISRLALAALAVLVVVRCGLSLLRDKSEPETWAWLGLGDGMRIAVNHWENIIGRGGTADIVLPLASVSRNHAALIRQEKGGWQLIDIAHKHNISVNGSSLEGSAILNDGDVIEIADCKMTLAEITPEEEERQRANRTVPGRHIRPSRTLGWLTIFMALMGLELALAMWDHALLIIVSYLLLMVLMWFSWLISRSFKRTGFEVETLGFFLTALGVAVVCSNNPAGLPKQMLTIVLGLVGFYFLGWVLRDMGRIKILRWPAAGLALLAMAAVLLFGQEIYGARNWLIIGGFSIQPSELVKVLFIFAGGATLDRLFARRNLYAFIALSAAIVGALALISDFGTAAIFFVVYIVIAYLRSGDLATIALSLSGAVLAVLLVLAAKPYIAERFATWGHAWEYASTGGYQQTRAMTVMASGGLFGLGGGQGWLKYVSASETDLVFAFMGEEWGLLICLCALAALILIALFAVRAAYNARSSYFVTTACGTAALLLFQTMLNVGGSLDILPLTGVTFPFVSTGGTSMIACWCLLAFIKAADTRQNASFAIKQRWRSRRRSSAPVIAPGPVGEDDGIFVPPVQRQALPQEPFTSQGPDTSKGGLAGSPRFPDDEYELQLPPIESGPAELQLPPIAAEKKEQEINIPLSQFPGVPPDIGKGGGKDE